MIRAPSCVAAVLATVAAMPLSLVAQESLCRDAERYLAEDVGMATVSEPDTIDDWRTRQRVPGCIVTAAGLTTRGLQGEARWFFERLRETKWTRTPDPRDSPNEASLRFRLNEVDCLFSFSSGGILGTEAEGMVDDARVPGPGELRYNFLVMCMPAMEAASRSVYPADASNIQFMIHHRVPSWNSVMLLTPRVNGSPPCVRAEA